MLGLEDDPASVLGTVREAKLAVKLRGGTGRFVQKKTLRETGFLLHMWTGFCNGKPTLHIGKIVG